MSVKFLSLVTAALVLALAACSGAESGDAQIEEVESGRRDSPPGSGPPGFWDGTGDGPTPEETVKLMSAEWGRVNAEELAAGLVEVMVNTNDFKVYVTLDGETFLNVSQEEAAARLAYNLSVIVGDWSPKERQMSEVPAYVDFGAAFPEDYGAVFYGQLPVVLDIDPYGANLPDAKFDYADASVCVEVDSIQKKECHGNPLPLIEPR
jgi:hypothetical protein